MNIRRPFGACLLLLTGSMHCAIGAAPPPTHFMRTKEAGNTVYLYAGIDAYEFDDGDETIHGYPVELRFVTPDDYEVSLLTDAGRESWPDDASFGAPDTVLTLRKAFRPADKLDYLTVEAGYRFAESNPGMSNEDSYFVRTRLQGGFTRLGFDGSITWTHPAHSGSQNGSATYFSLGWRGQFGRVQFGIDAFNDIEDNDASKDNKWASVSAMLRTPSGGAFYGTVQKRLSNTFDDWIAGAGFELRFDLP